MNTLDKDLSGELRIGTTPTLNMEVVPRCIAQFTQDHPSVHILVEEENGDELISGLQAKRLDLVLDYRPYLLDGDAFEPHYNEAMIMVVGVRQAFYRGRTVRMHEVVVRGVIFPPRKL